MPKGNYDLINSINEFADIIFKTRITSVILFVILSIALWYSLDSYRLRAYLSIIPLLFAVQIFLNDLLENYLVNKLKPLWFRIFILPGTIVHEISHLTAAILTGCEIEKLSFFSFSGPYAGFVNYKQKEDKWTTIRDLIIGFAPFFISGILFLSFLFLLMYLYPHFDFRVYSVNAKNLAGIIKNIYALIVVFYRSILILAIKNPLILVFLYLEICLALGSAPSATDLNGAIKSIIRYPISTVLLMLILLLVILTAENPGFFGKYGIMASNFIQIILDYIIFILTVSISLLIMAIPILYVTVKLTELKFIDIAMAILFSISIFLISSSSAFGLAAFLLSILVLRYPTIFLKSK